MILIWHDLILSCWDACRQELLSQNPNNCNGVLKMPKMRMSQNTPADHAARSLFIRIFIVRLDTDLLVLRELFVSLV